jgi:hypothetical protein
MFKMIGADQKEYGPVPAELLKEWIAQGRANGETLVRIEGGSWQPLASLAELSTALAAAAPPPPLSVTPPRSPSSVADSLSTVIPYRNVPALVAYYLAVFSLLPCIGALLGLIALILGVKGLRLARENPDAKGRVHAWIGIVVGGFFFVAYTILGIFIVAAMQRMQY